MEDQIILNKAGDYLNELKIKTNSTFVGHFSEVVTTIKKTYDNSKIGELNKKDKKYLEFVWSQFKIIFWDNEATASLKSSLFGPCYYKNEIDFNWITINLSPNENRYLKTKPFALYDYESKMYYYINKSLKYEIYNDESYKDSVFQKNDVFKNISEDESELLALQYRVSLYSKSMEIIDFNTNNLICHKLEYEKDKWIKVYSLTDYGIEDPGYNEDLGENSGKITDIILLFKQSYNFFHSIEDEE